MNDVARGYPIEYPYSIESWRTGGWLQPKNRCWKFFGISRMTALTMNYSVSWHSSTW